jgi:PPP family 3-phenylpropionic acid transporter
MAQGYPAIAGEYFAARLGAFYFAHFTVLGIQMPFLPVWLAAKGLDANAIGIVLAAPLVMRAITLPLATGVADRFDALRGTLMATAVAAAFGYLAVAFADGFWAILLTVGIASALFNSIFALSDAYALKGLAVRPQAYGPIRLWGSAAFIAGSVAAGLIAKQMPPVHFIWLVVAACLPMVLGALALPRLAPAPARGPETAGYRFLLTPAFLLVTASTSLIQSSHAVFYGFSTLAWTAAGLDASVIGGLWALGVVAEIIVFAVSARFPPAFGPTVLLGIGAVGAAIRWTMMALDPPALLLPVAQSLHGISFGATLLGSMMFLARNAPSGRGATAQGYFVLTVGLALAAMMALAGWLYEAVGTRAYGFMAVSAAIGGLLAGAAHRALRAEVTPP